MLQLSSKIYAVNQSYERCPPKSDLSLLQLPSLHPSTPKVKYYYLESQLEYWNLECEASW
jgi:hypothetical protein